MALLCETEAAPQEAANLSVCSTRPVLETLGIKHQRQQHSQLFLLLSTNAEHYHTTTVMSRFCNVARRDFRAAHISTYLESSTPPRLLNGAPQPRLCANRSDASSALPAAPSISVNLKVDPSFNYSRRYATRQ